MSFFVGLFRAYRPTSVAASCRASVGRLLRWLVLGLCLVAVVGVQSGCASNLCQAYFQELKRRCRLDSTAEGAKLDQFLAQTFRDCQIDLCNRTSINDIDCSDSDTHVPGGINGRFQTCE